MVALLLKVCFSNKRIFIFIRRYLIFVECVFHSFKITFHVIGRWEAAAQNPKPNLQLIGIVRKQTF